MYSRSSARDPRIPHNYGGNAFGIRGSTPVEDLTRKRPSSPQPEHQHIEEYDGREVLPPSQGSRPSAKSTEGEKATASFTSPIGELGTEELLLIALALIIFQSGKESQLSLILLALLFVQ